MSDVMERFFAQFDKKPADYYKLIDLDPSYRIFFGKDNYMDVTRDIEKNSSLFESLEKGAGRRLAEYLRISEFKYTTAINEFLYRDYASIFQFMNKKLMLEGLRLHIFKTLDSYAKRYFKSETLRKILEFNIVFLGCSPYKSPALYSLMSHVDMKLGVRYPKGGIYSFIEGLHRLCAENGVVFHFNSRVDSIFAKHSRAGGVKCGVETHTADAVISAADYHHTETELLDAEYRSYSKKYWNKRVMAPGALIVLSGVKKKLAGLAHHNLYLCERWKGHFSSIFDRPEWPADPSYYIGCPSASDASAAPSGCESLFVLVPIAPGLDDSNRETYSERIMDHLGGLLGEDLAAKMEFKKIISHRDFSGSHNYYRGTALGLAHTLFQTAVFRPSHRSKKLPGLYFTGHYTHPGIGMPMALIASEITAGEIINDNTK
jgi:phytoene desaturase